MMKNQLASLYDYGVWINKRLLDTAEALTADQFTRIVLPGFGSVHLTLAHLLGADVLWFARWQGQSPTTMLSPDDVTTLAEIRDRWAGLIDQRRVWFAGVDETELEATVRWTNMRGKPYALPRWQVILHCANHATHHRSEIAAMLTELGHEPLSSDLLEFYLERAGQPWKPTGQA